MVSSKKLIVFIFCFLLIALTLPSVRASDGTVELSGQVYNEKTKEPLPGATVFLPELKIGDVADEDGVFSIKGVARGRFKVVCQLLGYGELSKELLLHENTEIEFPLEPKVLKMSEVTVTADAELIKLMRSNQSVSVLESRELERTRGQTFGETLKEVPGVTVLQTGPSISKPVIRGLHSQRVLVLNAGLPQEGQQWGAEHAPEIDPFAPARIEVLKGAAGVEFGSSAIGGVVRVEPRAIADIRGFGGQATVNMFSNNRQGAGSVMLEGFSPVIDGLGWRLQGSLRRAGDSETPDYVINNSGFDEKDWSFAAGLVRDRGSLELYYSHFGTELGIYRGSHIGSLTDLERAIERGRPVVERDFTYDIDAPKQQVTHDLLSLKGKYSFESVGTLEAQYGYQVNQRQEFDAHRPFSSEPPTSAAFDLKLFTHTANVKFRHNPIKNFFGKIGLSGMRQGNVRKSSGFLIPNFRSYDFGAFLLENWSPGAFTANLGARFDYRWQNVFFAEDDGVRELLHEWRNVSGVLGLLYRFAPTWSVGANFGTAWRPPSVNELYSDGVHHGTATFEIGDPNLTTEKSLNLDATLRNVGSRSFLELSVYRNRINDFIFLFPEPEPSLTIRGAFPTFRYRQADAVLKGLDARFDYQVTNFYSLGARVSIVRGDNLDENEPLFQMPADRLTLVSRFDFPAFGKFETTFLKLTGTFVAEQDRFPQDADYTDPPPGYELFNLEIGTQFRLDRLHPINLSFGVHNLFNTAYRDYLSRFRYFVDDPGRNVFFKAQIPFGKFSTSRGE